MKPVQMTAFADDDGFLSGTDGALIVKKKLASGAVLDFSDIERVTEEFLDIALESEDRDLITERLLNVCPAVDQALAEWIDRGPRVKPVERPRAHPPKKPVSTGVVTRAVIHRAPVGDDRYTPTRLVARLKSALQGYIESAYPLADPILVRARTELLETAAEGRLLAQEPFIESTTRYKSSGSA